MFAEFEKVFTSYQNAIPDQIYRDIARVWREHKTLVEKFTVGRTVVGVAPTTDQSNPLPTDIKEKFASFIAEQKDISAEFAQIVNDNFWDLL